MTRIAKHVKSVSIYKPARRSRRDDPYLLAYKDPGTGKRRVVTGSTSLPVCIAKAHDIAARLDRIRLGMSDHKEDGYALAAAKPLEKHLEEYEAWLSATDVTKGHVRETLTLCRGIFALAGFKRLADITCAATQEALKAFREGEEGRDRSLRRVNAARTACKMFSKWLRKTGRMAEHVLADLKGFNIKEDVRRQRRALTDEEVEKLIASAESGHKKAGLSGPDRAMLYRVALGTGFRLGELRSLTPASFQLDDDPPTVTVQATHSKRRRTDVQPIRVDLADILRPWLEGRDRKKPAFPIKPEARAAVFVKWDLTKAGLPYRDADGRVADFHALRHTYITRLVRSGGSMKVAQDLARHSNINLTAGYAHMEVADHISALEALPPLGKPAAVPAKKKKGVG